VKDLVLLFTIAQLNSCSVSTKYKSLESKKYRRILAGKLHVRRPTGDTKIPVGKELQGCITFTYKTINIVETCTVVSALLGFWTLSIVRYSNAH
jgi:hypothetical protein